MSFGKFRTTVLIFGYLVVSGTWLNEKYEQSHRPPAIEVTKLTEKSITEGYRREQAEKAAQKAAAQKTKAIARSVAQVRDVFRKNGVGCAYSDLIGRTAVEFGVAPRLLAAVVFVESTCRPSARSGQDSIGLLQVNPRIWRYARRDLYDPATNLRIGTSILRNYIRRYGTIKGLHAYNGFGNPSNEYAMKVLDAEGWTVVKREEASL